MKKLGFLIAFITLGLAPFAHAAFDVNLKYGVSHSDAVTELQEFLTNQGVYNGPITGNFFSLTLKGVKNFQTAAGLPVTGIWGQSERDEANVTLNLSPDNTVTSSVSNSIVFCFQDGECVDAQGNVVKTIALTPSVASTDVCPNIEGAQSAIPVGLVSDTNGNCVVAPVTQTQQQTNTNNSTNNSMTETTPSAPVLQPLKINTLLFGSGHTSGNTLIVGANYPVTVNVKVLDVASDPVFQSADYLANNNTDYRGPVLEAEGKNGTYVTSFDFNTSTAQHTIKLSDLGLKFSQNYYFAVNVTDENGRTLTQVDDKGNQWNFGQILYRDPSQE